MLKAISVLFCLAASVSAHFRLLYPAPRGVFVAQDELQFCANIPNAVSNRTVFPLSGGYINIKTGHPNWADAVLISTDSNPDNWGDFNVTGTSTPQYAKLAAKESNPGTFCIPVDIKAANIPGVQDGSNVTIQVVFSGGDGDLYQCADLTLSATAQPPSDQPCTNTTDTAALSSIAAASASASASAGKPSQTSGAFSNVPNYVPSFSAVIAAMSVIWML